MNRNAFNRAQQLYGVIQQTRIDIKNIQWYEQKHFKSGIPLILKVPYTVGPYAVDSDVIITDKELIHEVLNCIKIHCVKTIQNAEKELEVI